MKAAINTSRAQRGRVGGGGRAPAPVSAAVANVKPFILAHKGCTGAVISLDVSALAMLAVPMAVRRIIDKGFGGNNSALINNYS